MLPKLKNLILVTLDNLRSDGINFVGKKGNFTPTLDKIASESILFDNCFTTSAHSAPSHFSILTGCNPYNHGVRSNSMIFNSKVSLLQELIAEREILTGAAVGGAGLSRLVGFEKGFNFFSDYTSLTSYPRIIRKINKFIYSQLGIKLKSYRNDKETLLAFTNFLRKTNNKPFFFWLHLFDLHGRMGEDYSSLIDKPTISDGLIDYKKEKENDYYNNQVPKIDKSVSDLFKI